MTDSPETPGTNRHANPETWRFGLLGYGEVGRILAEDLRSRGLAVAAFDIKLADEAGAAPLRAHAQAHGVRLADSHAALAAQSELVISAVTPDQTLQAAEACAPGMKRGGFFLDFNSASPATKQRAAALIDETGGRYVEAAVMTTVPPYRSRVPLLLGGASAADMAGVINAVGFDAGVASEHLGVASATKMCRSVMIKGLEAMIIESFTAARAHGVEDAVVASLGETLPGVDWEKQATHVFQRAIEHGRRRSEEMGEATRTVREAHLDPWCAAATAERQAWMADLADAGAFGPKDDAGFARSTDWRTEADRILAALKTK